ncbi:MAG: hypothetical protein DHS80DRAFT_22470 [Piptocephalis tieghemiana]|nr:MAG: hypothetical protein DHS80DRAFT_22470 [Piptocephalis tieghemiana]
MLPRALFLFPLLLQLVWGTFNFQADTTTILSRPSYLITGFGEDTFARQASPIYLDFNKSPSARPCEVRAETATPVTFYQPQTQAEYEALAKNPPHFNYTTFDAGKELVAFISFQYAVKSGCTTFYDLADNVLKTQEELRSSMNFTQFRTVILYVSDEMMATESGNIGYFNPLFTAHTGSANDGAHPNMQILLTNRASYYDLKAAMAKAPTAQPFLSILTDKGSYGKVLDNPWYRVFIIFLGFIMLGTTVYAGKRLYDNILAHRFTLDTRNLVFLLSLLSALLAIPAILVRYASFSYYILSFLSDLFSSFSLCLLLLMWIDFLVRTYYRPQIAYAKYIVYLCMLVNLAGIILNLILFAGAYELQMEMTFRLATNFPYLFIPAILISLAFWSFSFFFFIRRRTSGLSKVTSRSLTRLAVMGLVSPFSFIPSIINTQNSLLQNDTTPAGMLIFLSFCYLIMVMRTVFVLLFLGIVLMGTTSNNNSHAGSGPTSYGFSSKSNGSTSRDPSKPFTSSSNHAYSHETHSGQSHGMGSTQEKSQVYGVTSSSRYI